MSGAVWIYGAFVLATAGFFAISNVVAWTACQAMWRHLSTVRSERDALKNELGATQGALATATEARLIAEFAVAQLLAERSDMVIAINRERATN